MNKEAKISLRQVLTFYAPKFAYRELRHAAWARLEERVNASPYSFFEFLHYIIWYFQREEKECGLSLLEKPGLLADKWTWEGFLEWKEDRPVEVRAVVAQQNREARILRANGWTAYEVLTTKVSTLSTVVKLELMLTWAAELTLEQREKLLDIYADRAIELALGSPEYLEYAPRFRKLAATKEDYKWAYLARLARMVSAVRT